MSDLVETTVYEPGIYQIEITDPVEGGADGIANRPLKQLANRTAFLKLSADEVVAARGAAAALGDRLAAADADRAAIGANIHYQLIQLGVI